MDGWRGTPAALHNRLMAMLGWSEPYYKDVASLLLRLALEAPGEDGPIGSSQQLLARMDPELLVRVFEHDPDRLRDARPLVGRDQARAVKGAITRFANFFAAVGGGFDAGEGGWSFEDVDFRLAVTARVNDGDSWRDGDTSYFRINLWRQLAEHVADSLSKGDRAVVIGRLRSRSWETPEGDKRSVVEVEADEVAPSLRWAIAKPERAANGGKGKGEFNDGAPF
jgi:single-stranded DNA-binding protein